MTPERFSHLLSAVEPYLKIRQDRGRTAISAEERLVITLRYLATGDSMASQTFNFRVGRATVSNIIREICDSIWTALNKKYLRLPSSESEWMTIAEKFENDWNVPHAIGAVDGKHIAIECPKFGGSMYYNYKGFHSTVLMAICDASYSFVWTSIGSYGRDNDSAIFGASSFFKRADFGTLKLPPPSVVGGQQLPYVLLGDDIFPLKTWLIKPYGGNNLTDEEEVANYRTSRGRPTIENTFGVMAARWRIFRRPIRANIETVDQITKAVICLHNYLMQTDNAHYIPSGFVDSWSNAEFKEEEWRSVV
ncbi:uncharacterized protein [Antedon mediterranea]|uniref:uncharacterized protein n=1 Tax=Antedon mediterranea TaxID=105859 RepID=UPI003AF4C897